ncbi:ArsR/SmtB family transcription factor [Nocardia sp. CA-151230]|uniref:ArsR/SmtB family transcription factor n=1 Tax=Nocardia sp. CA-151230 TaxID=3239982 RepID=UPI003D8ECA72
MTLLRLNAVALTRCRFALSPLAETLGTLIALHRPNTDPAYSDRHARLRPALSEWLDRDPVVAGLVPLVAATKWFPSFVAIPPTGGMSTRLADELAAVAAYSDDRVRAEVRDSLMACWAEPDTGWLALDGLGPRIAAVFEHAWTTLVAPDWARRRAILDRDITFRAGLVADHGWHEAIASLRAKPIWSAADTAIRFSNQDYPDLDITEEGLIFVPRTTPGGWWTCDNPPAYALVYQARGTAAPAATTESDPLATLLGPGRARVTRELTAPATSTQLAALLDISLGTVGAHLGVLRDAGIIAGARTGRNVVYRLTPRGQSLLSALSSE